MGINVVIASPTFASTVPLEYVRAEGGIATQFVVALDHSPSTQSRVTLP